MHDANLHDPAQYETTRHTTSILGLEDGFKIDPINAIVAAGPVHRLDGGLFGESFKRAVLRINYEGSRYRVDIQILMPDGQHGTFDGTSGQLFDVYKDAFKAFLEVCIHLHNYGYAYHDGDSDSQRLKLEVVTT
jgi:hypothetical protein